MKSDTLKETSFWISGLKLTTKWLSAVCSRPLKPLSAPCRLRGKQKSDSALLPERSTQASQLLPTLKLVHKQASKASASSAHSSSPGYWRMVDTELVMGV